MDAHFGRERAVVGIIAKPLDDIRFPVTGGVTQSDVALGACGDAKLRIDVAALTHGNVAGRSHTVGDNQCAKALRQDQPAIVRIRVGNNLRLRGLTTHEDRQQGKKEELPCVHDHNLASKLNNTRSTADVISLSGCARNQLHLQDGVRFIFVIALKTVIGFKTESLVEFHGPGILLIDIDAFGTMIVEGKQ